MRLFRNRQGRALVRLAQVSAAAFGAAALISGCGNNYRPVVTPVNSSGPAAQPISWLIAVSAPTATSAGVATIIDYSGDSILVQVPIGIAPTTFTLDSLGANGYTINSDGTITNFPLSTSLQQKQETVSTLATTAKPLNMLATSTNLLINDLNGNVEDVFSGSPQTYQLSIPVAPTPVFTVGGSTGGSAREYVISQNFADPTGVACNTSSRTAGTNGVATPIELSNDTSDPAIQLDPFNQANSTTGSMNAQCPVYAVQSLDQRRVFVLNRGSDTISVINAQNNALDQCAPFVNQNGQPVTCHPILPLSTTAVTALTAASAAPGAPTGIPVTPTNGATAANLPPTAGPVYAEYNQATSQLVVADYDGGTISVIDVSLDEYGNDSATFGTTYTIPVGNYPASVTVLYDGSRAYTANQADGTVSVVNLSSHSVEKTLAVVGHPRTVVSTENSEYGKVYAGSPDSPYITIIETETDLIDTAVLVEGNVVDIRTTTQSGTSGNNNYTSRLPGYGQPCDLPPALLASTYPSGYTLANCRTLP